MRRERADWGQGIGVWVPGRGSARLVSYLPEDSGAAMIRRRAMEARERDRRGHAAPPAISLLALLAGREMTPDTRGPLP